MGQALFILLRIVVALASLGAFALTVAIIFFGEILSLLRDGGHVMLVLGRFLASGLRDPGPAPPDHASMPLSLSGLALAFLLMFIATLTPGQRLVLHLAAACAIAAATWRFRVMLVTGDDQLIYLPLIGLWLVYYILCLWRTTRA